MNLSKSKIIWLSIAGVLTVAAILDATRYARPEQENKSPVEQPTIFPVSSATEIVLVYNAYGGIYPGLIDFINKEFFPASYPCNLCYQTFGTFGMKDEWKEFLDSLPFKITELHKDSFRRKYTPENLQLPAILLSNGKKSTLLAGAKELNTCQSLADVKALVKKKLNKDGY